MPTLVWAHVCEYANMDSRGRLNIVGLSEYFFVDSFPAVLPHVTVITNWIGTPGESFSTTVRIVSDAGDEIRVAANPNSWKFSQPLINMVEYFVNVPFPSSGEYSVEILVNGEEVAALPIYLRQEE